MSVAADFAPSVPFPSCPPRLRPVEEFGRQGGPLASVAVLRPPADAARASLRLTRRGAVVLALAVALLGLAIVWVARLSAPDAPASGPSGPEVVTVQPGDTLWAIASRVAPGADPMAEVDLLRRLNHMPTPELIPGQRLRVR